VGFLLFVVVFLIHMMLGIQPSGVSLLLTVGGVGAYLGYKWLEERPASPKAPQPAGLPVPIRPGAPASTPPPPRRPIEPKVRQGQRTDLAACDVCGARVDAARLEHHKMRVHWQRVAKPPDPKDVAVTTAKATTDLVTCASGHENHVTRHICLICGLGLRREGPAFEA
jgi:hypothetical protein